MWFFLGPRCRALFPYRQGGGNAYLTETTDTPRLLGRIAAMIDQADYFVIMKGTLGACSVLVDQMEGRKDIGYVAACGRPRITH